jgi:hypothetical protein
VAESICIGTWHLLHSNLISHLFLCLLHILQDIYGNCLVTVGGIRFRKHGQDFACSLRGLLVSGMFQLCVEVSEVHLFLGDIFVCYMYTV